MARIQLEINGEVREVEVDRGRRLLSVLRDELDLTGTKYGCGEGECGACTVLIDGEPTRSCITSVGEAEGAKLTTIEGIARGEELHPLQKAFLDAEALQCGYCTSGMILSAHALLERKPSPTRQEIIEAMDGNICRCGTYQRIVAAIRQAAHVLEEEDQ